MVFKDGGVWSVCLLLAILTLSIILEALRNYYYGGLNRYPGPLLAKFTDFWHWLDVQSNQHHHHIIHLHRHYGDVVRIGPNKLSISRPDYVPHVYGVSTGFLKVRVIPEQ